MLIVCANKAGSTARILTCSLPVEAYEGLEQLNEVISDTVTNEEEISMLSVNSSVAYAIGYDADSQILQVEFQSGEVYQ
ncbi:KTSC domain-containing protein [Dolichospermum sp. LEGE 00240]|uniref:KTSC domain-containing protein n=1 Tax=Dolichospermum sp. LEGE 00240 TaxID=1828603 RepID=UPI00188129C1|nr:KTSC domain-containing protein [Dolichospermum sp. LEGE 00240]MBE9250862.1 KTSC domain-containing protein [Dolichospermum sp. LEGE 00240]